MTHMCVETAVNYALGIQSYLGAYDSQECQGTTFRISIGLMKNITTKMSIMLKNSGLRINAIVLLLTVLILAIGCSTSKEVKVIASVSGSQVELKKGQTLVIILESNPTTGYQWEVIECNDSILQQKGKAEFKSSDTSNHPSSGKGGTETFHFNAQSAGNGTLKLVYHRSWEKEVEPLRTFTLQVKVR